MSQDLKYLETTDGKLLIGAPNTINWEGSTAKLIANCLHVRKNDERLFFEDIDKFPGLVESIQRKELIYLSYANESGLNFTPVTVDVL